MTDENNNNVNGEIFNTSFNNFLYRLIWHQQRTSDDSSFGDCTSENISSLLSASFPSIQSGDIDEENKSKVEDENVTGITFKASTPIKRTKNSEEGNNSDTDDDEDENKEKEKQAFLFEFNSMSPIVFTSRNRNMHVRKKLRIN